MHLLLSWNVKQVAPIKMQRVETVQANLKSDVIKAELLSRGWKDHNENDCSANFSDSAGPSSTCDDPMEDVARGDPSSTHSDQTGIEQIVRDPYT